VLGHSWQGLHKSTHANNQTHKKSFVRVLCSQDDHVKENMLISGFEEEKSFEGDIKDWI
jgi:hypothetical protein